jgi:hypothetical protein
MIFNPQEGLRDKRSAQISRKKQLGMRAYFQIKL